MPGRILPTLTQAEVESHNNAKSCYVTIGPKVYDITSFVDDHPGGGDLILEYAGKDVGEILADVVSHEHSESAYEILEDSLVGFVGTASSTKANVNGAASAEETARAVYESTGMATEEDLSIETDITKDYQQHKFLDLNKPLLMQLWNSGFSKQFYLEQIHRPRHYRGGDSAPLFGNFLEPLSKTAWYVVPIMWLPCIAYGTTVGLSGMSSASAGAGYWAFGLFFWTLIEYVMHRFLFHIDTLLPDNRVGITLHFLLHGIHHYLPMDKYRLVMPPTLFVLLAAPFWKFAHSVIFYDWYAAVLAYCGGVFGYVCYDMTHYFLHHRNLPSYYKSLKKYHLQHHFADFDNGFGVTSRFWDRIFGTELETPAPSKIVKTQ
ncbi:fatty acid alpha-hydroxylase [Aspergillus ruber CBS 135680]|uniref:Ceramide very long chain fatty acid hydroxylase n=1 Tax=Aspergillus ruber (strain CBS 135680) TaxID=1388766 RepID=A0A017SQ25_ASPRC|nr:Inositolphosphorylceramide-B hydroxylase [Aspergillus ruber CBS 135680]EYE98921.1 Inositolphosphorylceramide-B hydroxylase [Aspergillus ruber CBS 135680]